MLIHRFPRHALLCAALTLSSSLAFSQTRTKSVSFEQLPKVDATQNTEVVLQALQKETPLGENTAVQVKLPAPTNRKLAGSLVRVLGDPKQPMVLFRSDALVKLGVLNESAGADFFTLFGSVATEELRQRVANEKELASGKFGEVTRESIVFSGRSAVARALNPLFDIGPFLGGGNAPVLACGVRPVSTQARWDESLLVRSAAVVQDPARTFDPCTGAGTPGGVWTFAHLMREMAQGSGTTPENFTLQWLSNWLNPITINGDTVAARTTMFNTVIQPWAVASGVSASLVNSFGILSVSLSGPLNLEVAPFRLLAIVNRADLGRTTSGSSGYGGTVSARPVDAGELRFVFGVVGGAGSNYGGGNPSSCQFLPFSVIFEYGVPVSGCSAVVAWAKKWTQLNTFGGFTPAYLSQLQNITESVVLHGAAPSKGNQNAINQIRTNEIALAQRWELREFTLSNEAPSLGTDTPASGLLRPHTVAQTPNDSPPFSFTGNPTINAFVLGPVRSGVSLPVTLPGGATPARCSSNYTVPFSFLGAPFRGGNAMVDFSTAWTAFGANSTSPQDVCARHAFSLNTCNGCHAGDTGTVFTHIDPSASVPVTLSSFLTGGGAGFTSAVNDTQFGSPTWQFADLQRRFERLYDLSKCTACSSVVSVEPAFLERFAELARVVPIDPIDPVILKGNKLPIGPVTDLDVVRQLLDLRTVMPGPTLSAPVDFIVPGTLSVH